MAPVTRSEYEESLLAGSLCEYVKPLQGPGAHVKLPRVRRAGGEERGLGRHSRIPLFLFGSITRGMDKSEQHHSGAVQLAPARALWSH